ncbi:MAG TPA: Z1 domain-containing protein [Phenylobacterium sp.]|uniref:Z1 domain-containing protein n=1 Tax=Phenylobacterium sp. TaxID=1871053 RepID=UPI002F95EAE1
MNATQDTRQRVVKFVQELIADDCAGEVVTPRVIDEKIDEVLRMRPRWGEGLDRGDVVAELVRRFSVWIGDDATLVNEAGHVAWLNAARKKDWRYWQRYREWSEVKISDRAVDGLDRSTDTILGLLEDPQREGPWDRRGLVVGHVQSGKTGNYTGLICKAADAGYKVIIVLAGLHNNLRSQTQMRLDEGFLGYETRPISDELRLIGVGEIDRDPSIRPNSGTDRTDGGDFNARASRLAVSPEQRPWLFVVKKNKTVLERLNNWIRTRVADAKDPETGRPIVTNLPLLVIDDEADHASVDTGEQYFDEDGQPDLEHEPKQINRLIRRILHGFSRSAYVGYTATPFANIFIHERGATEKEGPDLFPESFIVSLAAPSNYMGPARIFGLQTPEGRTGLPLLRPVSDFASEDGSRGWMPQRHRSGHEPLFEGADELPPSLREAIDAFLLACTARNLRGQVSEHASMLVHVTRFNLVQKVVTRQVDEYVSNLRQRLTRKVGAVDILRRLETLWHEDFELTTAKMAEVEDGLEPLSWEEVRDGLADAVSDIEVRMINGTAKDALDYADRDGVPLRVIAIGGDKLARGLTLEGLVVSYFLRASKMYDTLMQMGRWFGYRPGYADLCRLYTTDELISWFGHIADAAEELREEFDLMAASGSTPRQYGLKVQSHPVLMVTSRVKMRSARNLLLSFSGHLLETVVFHRDTTVLKRNFEVAQRFVEELGKPSHPRTIERVRGSRKQRWDGSLWENVPYHSVLNFMNGYTTHDDALKVNSRLIAEFIAGMAEEGELTRWTVALIGGGDGPEIELIDGQKVKALVRADKNDDRTYSIGRLLSPRDEAIDLDEDAWEAALSLTRRSWRGDPAREQERDGPELPNGPAIREVRGKGLDNVAAHPERGLLLLYLITPRPDEKGVKGQPVVAMGVSFPGSRAGRKVSYMVNNVGWELDYGSED